MVTSTLRFLLEVRVRIDPKTDTDHTLLHLAATCGHLDIVRLLLESGADHRVRLKDGKTPLDVVAFWRSSGDRLKMSRLCWPNEAGDGYLRRKSNVWVGNGVPKHLFCTMAERNSGHH